MQEYNILSLNVRGLRNKEKRREMFHWLKQYNGGDNSFIFLQETHSDKMDELIWQREWGSKKVI